ncbi:hypothetical protein HMPREF1977_1289 [Capnocytophaga ochracea F0287]|uniref:Uncharacterized protein n=1 Tax=Capnocytophaga ochracea F0287 TaxID=873517 RepID=E4MSN4_CAPOC|nr:hypothetical protein [Capnocytophaga ochracea]EFS97306.1 hypothetical protein HMPREF1977_1289 [Capnocytophaga ochracea F0287]EJF43360.1 hypothetical protein HMPREF1319_2197 [Capnocytophaga ochracea str. Holt 25]UEB44257.1 hypothetical protein LK419_04505 [Capnocytophaga ochracea]
MQMVSIFSLSLHPIRKLNNLTDMKLHTLTLFAGLFVAQVSFAQVDEMGTMTDTTTQVVAPAPVEATQVQTKEELKTQQKLQKEQEKALKAEQKATKEQEKAAKEQQKAAARAQKNQQRLSKANSEVSKIEAKITKAQTDLAKEQNKYNLKKAKGALSPQDDAKFKGRILNKEQKINSLNLDLIKAKEKVNKYQMAT